MIIETLIVCSTICILFGPYINAQADIVRETARRMEIENDRAELTASDIPLWSETTTTETVETK